MHNLQSTLPEAFTTRKILLENIRESYSKYFRSFLRKNQARKSGNSVGDHNNTEEQRGEGKLCISKSPKVTVHLSETYQDGIVGNGG